MARTHYQTWELDDGREVEVEFTFTPGYPETGPSYASGGEPAEPPEVEIVAIHCDGAVIEVGLEEQSIADWLIENFEDDDDGPDPDDWRDRMIDDRLTGGDRG